MYDIKNLNIWKDAGSRDDGSYRELVLEVDAPKRRENVLSMKTEMVINEMMQLVPAANWKEIKARRGGKLRFPMYLNASLNETDLEALDLSPRSSNCLHRAGFKTIGDMVNQINGSEDLMKIRNCGKKSVDEIMENLFCYQYQVLKEEKKVRFAKRVLELNG